MKESEKRICTCDDKKNAKIIHIDTLVDENQELGSYNGYYCIDCNSFWREP
ncbi:hypothetical protein AAGG74_15545 [Bacillus mexicanus]|uniref:hypothetical protein n=1 Tax=Bacillus mexicanus TaxID=2834415 RepID=UPI003D24E4F8